MSTPPLVPDDDDDLHPIADASSFFQEERPRRSSSKRPSPPPPEPEPLEEDLGGDYDLADPLPASENLAAPQVDPEFAPPPRVAPQPEKKRAREANGENDFEGESSFQPESRVDEVWSRWGEWKLSLIAVAVVAVVTFWGTLYIKAAVFFPLGCIALLILSYPLAITLERPVRVTPEQAAKDYYGALSHFLPHTRRMWLLLSSQGKISNQYGNYAEFKSYWKRKLASLQGGKSKFFNPLIFEIATFKGEKSVGKSTVDAKFTVAVRLRGKPDEEPIEVARVTTTLVRGPDNMWYLDQGTLPGRQV